MSEQTIIRNRKTIYEALMHRFCKNCSCFFPDEIGCDYEETHYQDEDQCLVTLVMNTLSDWDWPDSEGYCKIANDRLNQCKFKREDDECDYCHSCEHQTRDNQEVRK